MSRLSTLILTILLAGLLVAACSGATGSSAPAADSADTAAQPAPAEAPVSPSETFRDLPVGFTDDGHPYRGNPDAPVTIFEFSDFQCPFCARHFVQTEPALDEAYVRTGQVKVVFRDLPLESLHPNAPAAHEAAACVADQGAAAYWAMHDALFQSQDEWGESDAPGTIFERLVGELSADVDAFRACVAGTAKEDQVRASVDAALALGFDGTPSFQIVGGDGASYALVGAQPFDRFASTLDAVLAGDVPPNASQPEQPAAGIPFWATAEGLAVDPSRPNLTVAGDWTRGDPDAEVVVVEFSDFQCPYCKQHVERTQPALDEQFVQSGQVRWVFKHYPLSFHAQAPAAGVAAECAAEQGKFWEMHDALFTNVERWSVKEPAPVFIELAGGLGLDGAAFETCLADPQMAARVDSDTTDGAAYVQGTPTFVILAGGGGRIIPGALPLQSFTNEIQKVLDSVGS